MTLFIASCATADCSLMEAGPLGLNSPRLQTLKRQGHKHAAIWLAMKQNIHRPVAVILILDTVAHTGGATIAGAAFDEIFSNQWLWMFSTAFTIVILVGIENIPKLIGVAFSERLAPWIGVPFGMLTTLLRPLVFLSELLSHLIHKRSPGEAGMSASDLRTLAGLARTNQAIGAEQECISINTTRLQSTQLESVMATRERIEFLQFKKSDINNFELVATRLRTRFPASETDGVDRIVDYVNFKEIVGDPGSELGFLTEEVIAVAEGRWKVGGCVPLGVLSAKLGNNPRAGAPGVVLSDWLSRPLQKELVAGDTGQGYGLTFTALQIRRHRAHRVLAEVSDNLRNGSNEQASTPDRATSPLL